MTDVDCARAQAAADARMELDACIGSAELAMRAVMGLLAAAPHGHQVDARALHALLLGVQGQIETAAHAARVLRQHVP